MCWILEFEGAYRDTVVTLNGQPVCENHMGTMGLYADLTPFLAFDCENEIVVTVQNDRIPNARWYTGSGILRPVWLYTGPRTRISHKGLRVSTPEVAEDVSLVRVETPVLNGYDGIAHVRLDTIIFDKTGFEVCRESTPVTLFPGENPVITQRLYMRSANLWSPQSPTLYTCQVTLREDIPMKSMAEYQAWKTGRLPKKPELDRESAVFGIRHIQLDPVYGLRINGQKFLLRGACIHADHGLLGGAVLPGAELRRVQRLKEAGFNAVRIAHQPAAKSLLDACDQEGMLLMEETFDIWTDRKTAHDDSELFLDHWQSLLEYMVEKDFNHPCVILYSIGNEITILDTDPGAHLSRLLSDELRRLDSTRFITNVVNGGMAAGDERLPMLIDMGLLTQNDFARIAGKPDATIADFSIALSQAMATGNINDLITLLTGKLDNIVTHPVVAARLEEIFSHLDACGYNYMMPCYQNDTKQHPNRINFGSETNPPKIGQLWQYAISDPANLGDFTWAGWDYLGETGVGITHYEGQLRFSTPYPALLAYCGDIDIIGWRRPLSYLREIAFGLRTQPYLSTANPAYYGADARSTPWAVTETVHSWTWRGYEGNPIHVEVYSPGDEVALLFYGEEVGRAAVEDFRAGFELTYRPGMLEAVCYKNGIEAGRDMLKTAEGAEHICVSIEKYDGLTFIEAQVMDRDGTPVMDKEHKVVLETTADFLAFGSANPMGEARFYSMEQTSYRGCLLAIIRGWGSVTVAAEGMPPVHMKLSEE